MEELGFALRLARERRGLTQKQVMTMKPFPAMKTVYRSLIWRPLGYC